MKKFFAGISVLAVVVGGLAGCTNSVPEHDSTKQGLNSQVADDKSANDKADDGKATGDKASKDKADKDKAEKDKADKDKVSTDKSSKDESSSKKSSADRKFVARQLKEFIRGGGSPKDETPEFLKHVDCVAENFAAALNDEQIVEFNKLMSNGQGLNQPQPEWLPPLLRSVDDSCPR